MSKPQIERVWIKREVDDCPDLSSLGHYTQTPLGSQMAARRVVDRQARGDMRERECRFFVAALSAKDTGNPNSVQEDYERMEAYNRGEWCALGIVACAEISTRESETMKRVDVFTSSGLWGVESDSSAEYLAGVAREQLADLRAHLKRFGVSVRNFDKLAAQAVLQGV